MFFAALLIARSPDKYGINVDVNNLFMERHVARRSYTVNEFVRKAGLRESTFRDLNPHIRGKLIPAGVYVYVPKNVRLKDSPKRVERKPVRVARKVQAVKKHREIRLPKKAAAFVKNGDKGRVKIKTAKLKKKEVKKNAKVKVMKVQSPKPKKSETKLIAKKPSSTRASEKLKVTKASEKATSTLDRKVGKGKTEAKTARLTKEGIKKDKSVKLKSKRKKPKMKLAKAGKPVTKAIKKVREQKAKKNKPVDIKTAQRHRQNRKAIVVKVEKRITEFAPKLIVRSEEGDQVKFLHRKTKVVKLENGALLYIKE